MNEVMQHANTNTGIIFSEPAQKHVLSYLMKKSEYKGVRISVKKTGCSGLSYHVEYGEAPLEGDIVTNLINDYLVFIDKSSYPHLKGMSIDYVKIGLNYKFVFNNPNQTGQCGCGESFTVD